MGIVERLRRLSAWLIENDYDMQTPEDACDPEEAADLIERLRGYAAHTDECAISGWLPRGDEPCPPCTCGLTALIKEIEGD